eukprot:CAMPEP_0119108250 /NCGR_PEP_ID=MMETSP1180-20130426/13549_1 /TAXON_ID=3052 ORGANISM="Chlamydomonas cf sp, Strain CCMP681" /NCGR_SAMPLE_ID=MMETSP1180 /ASSEMBLY_ACC=CAM_ASM_000741 /LENGTH=40 /DNA_ID= /DNA_START= /DNA_END= /DNA_ORIENTATION=
MAMAKGSPTIRNKDAAVAITYISRAWLKLQKLQQRKPACK